jgi:hypothetical protein
MNSTTLPAAFHSLVSLLETEFAHLRFPGIDGGVLQTLQHDVAAAESAVRSAEQALEDARSELKAKEAVALERAERALSFLKVCAADDAALAQAIAGLTLTKTQPLTEDTAPKRRGRPRKTEAPLFPSLDAQAALTAGKDDAALAVEAALHA